MDIIGMPRTLPNHRIVSTNLLHPACNHLHIRISLPHAHHINPTNLHLQTQCHLLAISSYMVTVVSILSNVPSLHMICNGGLIRHQFGGWSVGFGARLGTVSQHWWICKCHLFVAATAILDDEEYDRRPQFQSEACGPPPLRSNALDITSMGVARSRSHHATSFANSLIDRRDRVLIPRHPPLARCSRQRRSDVPRKFRVRRYNYHLANNSPRYPRYCSLLDSCYHHRRCHCCRCHCHGLSDGYQWLLWQYCNFDIPHDDDYPQYCC